MGSRWADQELALAPTVPPAAARFRSVRRGDLVAQRRKPRQPEQPPAGPVRDLDGNSNHANRVQQLGGVLTAMPRSAASQMAESSGAAARSSTAAAACEVRRRPARVLRAANQAHSKADRRSSASAAWPASTCRNAGTWAVASQRVSARSAGQRHRHSEQVMAGPEAHQDSAKQQLGATLVEPGGRAAARSGVSSWPADRARWASPRWTSPS